LKALNETGGSSDTDGDDGDPGGPDAPLIEDMDRYRNEDTFFVKGTAPAGVTVTLTTSGDGTEEIAEAPAPTGVWEVQVTIARGSTITFSAVAEDDAGLRSATSNQEETEACDPPDIYDIVAEWGEAYGDTCGTAHAWETSVSDDLMTSTAIGGNIHSVDDVDWWRVTARDLGGDEVAGFENFHFQAAISTGTGTFDIMVFKGGCGEGQQECGETDGYDEYSYFSEDVEPDESGSVPSDSRACGAVPLNECKDYSDEFFVRVRRTDGAFDCTPYVLEVSNGIW
jgi:hypothetical protein